MGSRLSVHSLVTSLRHSLATSLRHSLATSLRHTRVASLRHSRVQAHLRAPLCALRVAALFVAASMTAPSALAQLPVVHLNGPVYDGFGGPFVGGFVYHIVSDTAFSGLTVPEGETLTILPGAIVKIGGTFTVVGTLIADGANFTSWNDDSLGGDSNENGDDTLPFAGNWGRIELSGPGSVVQNCAFTYGGSSGSTLWFRGVAVTFRNSAVVFSAGHGIDLGQSASTVEDSTLSFCSGRALTNGWFGGVELLSDITAFDNAGGNYAHFSSGSGWTGTLDVQNVHSVNGAGVHVLETFSGTGSSALQVASGAVLNLEAGTILKFVRGVVVVNGTLHANGTEAAPVVFTSLEDDTRGGDTNADGAATTPTPGDWDGIRLQSGADASTLAHAKVLWGGAPSMAALHCLGTGGTFTDCEVAHSPGEGFSVSFGSGAGPASLVRCLLRDNGSLGLSQLRWRDLEASRDNVLQGNAGGNHVTVQGGNLFGAIDGLTPACLPGPLVLYNTHNLTPGSSLTLPPGAVLKMTTMASLQASPGRLRIRGTGAAPVVITSIADDSIGGDTNGDGAATMPAPGDWGRIVLNGVGCAIEHAQIRYGGRNSPCIDVSQSDTLLRAVQVGFALSDGFELDTMTQDAIDLVAHDCGHDGIFLRSGAFDVLHATVADNGGAGLRRWFQSGQVRNSVSWNNAEGNYVGLPVADVHFSDGGFPGVNGNIDQDPQFERTTDFDLRLGARSPCLDVADFSTAATVASDADEASRVSDHELLGVMAADMGAFERAAFTVSSTGALRPGQAPAFAVEGPPAFAVVIVGFLDFEVLLAPYGVDLAGVVGSFTLGLGLTEQPFVLAIPDDASLLGLELGVQGLGLVFVDGAWLGGFTNLYRGRIY